MMITGIHHIALIVSDAEKSVAFYEETLGFSVLNRTYREERQSWKIDMVLSSIQLELFTFPNAPNRPSHPEAIGLRHLAFSVQDISIVYNKLNELGRTLEPIRVDMLTGKRFFFTSDPDGLPIEFYET